MRVPGIELMKDGLAETLSIAEFLCSELTAGDKGCSRRNAFYRSFGGSFAQSSRRCRIGLVTDFDVIDRIWLDRPALPAGKIFVHDIKYSGCETVKKIADILADAEKKDAQGVFVAMLDEVAWILNIRCNDVNHTPVATAFLYLSAGSSVLFIDSAKLTTETQEYLASQGGVSTREYVDVKSFLASLPQQRVLVDAAHTAKELLDILGDKAVDGGTSAASVMKSVKNEVQLEGVRAAMLRDGVAMVRSLMEIENRMAKGC